jgi:hypothetical protein
MGSWILSYLHRYAWEAPYFFFVGEVHSDISIQLFQTCLEYCLQ